jgi:hypothetical protein
MRRSASARAMRARCAASAVGHKPEAQWLRSYAITRARAAPPIRASDPRSKRADGDVEVWIAGLRTPSTRWEVSRIFSPTLHASSSPLRDPEPRRGGAAAAPSRGETVQGRGRTGTGRDRAGRMGRRGQVCRSDRDAPGRVDPARALRHGRAGTDRDHPPNLHRRARALKSSPARPPARSGPSLFPLRLWRLSTDNASTTPTRSSSSQRRGAATSTFATGATAIGTPRLKPRASSRAARTPSDTPSPLGFSSSLMTGGCCPS